MSLINKSNEKKRNPDEESRLQAVGCGSGRGLDVDRELIKNKTHSLLESP